MDSTDRHWRQMNHNLLFQQNVQLIEKDIYV